MPLIQQLSPHLADMIAAGEVVERPASVVKELLENAIDAGASAITVELRRGGMGMIRVTDNGCGIAPAELPTAFLRHATSKLRTEEELACIGTLGFRGEALAAISAVSRIEIQSRRRGADKGARLTLEAGIPGRVEEFGCPEGTTVIVQELFYNTPARMKFMKTDRAEASAAALVVQHEALSHEQISFRLIRDGVDQLHTPGDGKLLSAVYAALGRDFALGLLETHGNAESILVEGYITKTLQCRGNRAMQHFFVNGRYVKSPLLTAALEEAYRNQLLKGRFPGCVLQLCLPLDQVDVNVHPAKTVVKFLTERAAFDAVYYAVKSALEADALPKTAAPAAAPVKKETFYQTMSAQEYRARAAETSGGKPLTGFTVKQTVSAPSPAKAVQKPVHFVEKPQETPVIPSKPVEKVTPPAETLRVADIAQPGQPILFQLPRRKPAAPAAPTAIPVAEAAPAAPAMPLNAPAEKPKKEATPVQEQLFSGEDLPGQETLTPPVEAPWRIVGEVLRTYIIAEDAAGTVHFIDKHAAHERVNFDRMKQNTEPLLGQQLLTPETVTLPADAYAVLLDQLPLLNRFGFEAEDFGDNTILCRTCPAEIDAAAITPALEELAETLLRTGRADPDSARDTMLHTMACKAAIKAGMVSDPAELRVLVEKVRSGEIKFCPHGRPVEVSFSKYQIEKWFKRA